MGGVLVLAAGVQSAFEERDFATVTLGYVLMRVAMLAQWLRAAQGDAERRGTALRYAAGIAVVQVGWGLRLLLPGTLGLVGFLVLVLAELSVPVWAERHRGTPWHPHHIAERYGLFTIIVLGEVVLAATRAVQTAVSEEGVGVDVVLLGAAALLLSVGLWWLYFLKSNGPALERRPELSFLWGYGHYGIYASIAAVGAGLEVAVAAVDHELEVSDRAAFVLLVWALHAPLAPRPGSHLVAVLTTVAVVVLLAVAVGAGLAPTWAVLLMVVPVAALVAVGVASDHRRHADAPARMAPAS
jgi:low temperature requirement protein LtrA